MQFVQRAAAAALPEELAIGDGDGVSRVEAKGRAELRAHGGHELPERREQHSVIVQQRHGLLVQLSSQGESSARESSARSIRKEARLGHMYGRRTGFEALLGYRGVRGHEEDE